MAFLRAALPEDYLDPIRGPRLMLRAPTSSDYSNWAELRAMSRSHLTPWEPAWSRDELSRSSFRRRLRAYAVDARDDAGYSMFIVDNGVLLGGITLSNIRRGASQSAALGYWIGAPYAGRGYMQEAVRMMTGWAFGTARLHRLEAACMLSNFPSQRVLEKNAFVREGLARRYLRINGTWEDHYIYGMIEPERAVSAQGSGDTR